MNPMLIGVTSFGKGCGSSTPGVYVRLSEYIGWIESVVGVSFDPLQCVWRYVEYREYEPDIIKDISDGQETLDFTKLHIDVGPDKFDHLAQIGWRAGKTDVLWGCSGTFITELYVLTAASCLLRRG